jgi:hypothetical protein
VEPFTLTNKGLRISIPIYRTNPFDDGYVGVLGCVEDGQFREHIGLSLKAVDRSVLTNVFSRDPRRCVSIKLDVRRRAKVMDIYLLRRPSSRKQSEGVIWIRKIPEDTTLEFVSSQSPRTIWEFSDWKPTIELPRPPNRSATRLDFEDRANHFSSCR